MHHLQNEENERPYRISVFRPNREKTQNVSQNAQFISLEKVRFKIALILFNKLLNSGTWQLGSSVGRVFAWHT